MSKHYGELIKARLEQASGAIAQVIKGLIYFREDINRPYIDDGTDVSQVMMEKHLAEARRNTKVQLDDTGTGNEISGVLPVSKGGTNKSSLTGFAGQALIVNDAETGFEFGESGGGGGLDVWYKDDIETNAAADYTSEGDPTFGVTNEGFSGALADQSGASRISGDNTLQYTQAAGSLNDWFKSPLIPTEVKQRGNFSGATFWYSYDGNDDDLEFVIYDETNSEVILSEPLPARSSATRYSTSFTVPSTANNLSWGIHCKTENSGSVLLIDDLELTTNPFVIQDLILTETVLAQSNAGQSITPNVTNIPFTEVEDDSNLFDGSVITVPRDGTTVHLEGTVLYNTNKQIGLHLYVNGSYARNLSYETSNDLLDFSHVGKYNSGDTLSIREGTVSGTLAASATAHYLAVSMYSDSRAIIVPSKLPKTYTVANGDFTITDANWTTNKGQAVPYRTSDGQWRMKFNFDGSYSGKASNNLFTLTFSGITSANFQQAISVHDESNQSRGSDQSISAYLLTSSSSVRLMTSSSFSPDGSWAFSGDVALAGKPTWAEEVGDQMLSTLPEDIGIKPAVYGLGANATISSGVATKINFDSLVTDQDGLVTNPSSDWKYIVPKDGVYQVTGNFYAGSYTWPVGTTPVYHRLYVNGATSYYIAYEARSISSTESGNFQWRGTVRIPLSKGDELEIYAYHEKGSDQIWAASTFLNNISITKEQSTVTLGADIRQEELTKAADNQFTGGNFHIVRVGKQVTITAKDNITHASASSRTTSVGFLPTWARPSQGKGNVYWASAVRTMFVYVENDGSIRTDYWNWAGNAFSTTFAGQYLTITYNVD